MRVVRVIRSVFGAGVRYGNIIGNLLGGVCPIFAGKQVDHLKMIAHTRHNDLEQLADYGRLSWSQCHIRGAF